MSCLLIVRIRVAVVLHVLCFTFGQRSEIMNYENQANMSWVRNFVLYMLSTRANSPLPLQPQPQRHIRAIVFKSYPSVLHTRVSVSGSMVVSRLLLTTGQTAPRPCVSIYAAPRWGRENQVAIETNQRYLRRKVSHRHELDDPEAQVVMKLFRSRSFPTTGSRICKSCIVAKRRPL